MGSGYMATSPATDSPKKKALPTIKKVRPDTSEAMDDPKVVKARRDLRAASDLEKMHRGDYAGDNDVSMAEKVKHATGFGKDDAAMADYSMTARQRAEEDFLDAMVALKSKKEDLKEGEPGAAAKVSAASKKVKEKSRALDKEK